MQLIPEEQGLQSKPSPAVISKKDARLTIEELRGGQASSHYARKTNDHHSEKGISRIVIYKNSGKYDTARVSKSTKAGQMHGPASCTKKSSFESEIEVTLE